MKIYVIVGYGDEGLWDAEAFPSYHMAKERFDEYVEDFIKEQGQLYEEDEVDEDSAYFGGKYWSRFEIQEVTLEGVRLKKKEK